MISSLVPFLDDAGAAEQAALAADEWDGGRGGAEGVEGAGKEQGVGEEKRRLWEKVTPWHAAAVEKAAERKRAEEVEGVYQDAAVAATLRKNTALQVSFAAYAGCV